MQTKNLTFGPADKEFFATLNKRVNAYFKSNSVNRHANGEMITKTIIMFALYLVPYGLIVGEVVTGMLWLILLVIIMSLGKAGIGLSVMHDANHGAYSKNSWINTFMGYSINMVGANLFNWKIQHNVLHHSFTNVHEVDEDIASRGVLRLTPHSKWKKMYKYQYIYAWFLYGLMTIMWFFFSDFKRIIKYHKNGLARKHDANIVKEWIILIASKLLYVGSFFIIPLMVTSLLWWQILIGLVLMHYIAGFILAIIFQSAHVIEDVEFPLPNERNALEYNWAVHQLRTTINFSTKSRWFSWYVGGLNFQIEHHLFPNICHVHYRKIAAIVKSTASEFGLPYHSARTFVRALHSHLRLLRQLGVKPAE